VEGELDSLDRFLAELIERPPPHARIYQVRCVSQEAQGESAFRIEASAANPCGPVFIQPDIATCENCLAELFDPGDRRYRHPFLNCCACGPRLTIIKGAPYDRARTTMAGFAMCRACRAEYSDPADRRFHAQPIACPECGPRLHALDANGLPMTAGAPLALAVAALRGGHIVALKGLGGYHLACTADCARAVVALRQRKDRDEKPFALMVADGAAARTIGVVSDDEERLLLSPERPIVLLRRRSDARVADEVAPGNPHLGVMLPYTPLHHLLLRDLDGTPLVMTSGNRSDEPIAYEDADALDRLKGIADIILTHNRPIHLRCDDSVLRVEQGEVMPLRRSRGYAPQPIRLPLELKAPALALGGQLKATFALGQGRHAFLSHHLGDLDHYEAYRAYVQAIEHYRRLWAIEPELIVHDLHPDYASTRYAQASGRKLLAVQHHHSHLASCMAEHGLDGPAIGVIFDGTGFGPDGTIWGGEFLIGDYRTFTRAAHFRCVPMPGGEQAIREPWRMALAYLRDAGIAAFPVAHASGSHRRIVEQMLERGVNSPLTSSVGRLFDAVASLVGVRQRVSYEGQAALELECLAAAVKSDVCYPFEIGASALFPHATPATLQVDARSVIAAIVHDVRAGVSANTIGRRFHATLVEIIAQVCRRICTEQGLDRVVLSGGVFMNALLLAETMTRLTRDGFHVFRHRQVPPNDGGLSLGQLAIAAANMHDL
jgi:hydrogenase maturation protein HypF